MKYKRIKLCILFLLALIGLMGVQAQSLYVLERTGTKTSFALTDIKTLTFSGENLNVNKKDGDSSSTPLSGIQFLGFTLFTDMVPIIEANELMLYPNPVQDVLRVNYQTGNNPENVLLEIFTIDGKIVYSERYNPSALHTINVSNWRRGLYLLRINDKTGLVTKKIIKN